MGWVWIRGEEGEGGIIELYGDSARSLTLQDQYQWLRYQRWAAKVNSI